MNARFRQFTLLALWSLLLLAACLALHTRHQKFPYFYHPDEPGKVEQVLTGERNFHHPMLLLDCTKLALQFSATPRDPQSIVEVGRWVSAGFTAIAVVALSLVAYLWRGWPGAVTAGVVLTLHHQLYELSHYMKEDASMLMGLALTFLAAALYWQQPGKCLAGFLGMACALAISGKYMGVISVFIAAPVLWRSRDKGHLALFALSLLGLFAWINFSLLMNLGVFQKSFGREMEYVVSGQKGMTRSVPHAQYWSAFLDNSTPAIWLLLGIFLVARWREWRAINAAEWGVIAFPFAYALMLSFSPKSNDRYFLPASALLTLLAVLGVEDAAHLLAKRASRFLVLSVGAGLLVVFQITGWAGSREGLLRYEEAFQHDDLQELISWINTELPPDAVIAKDNRVGLPDPKKKKHASRMGVISQKVISARYAADLGTLDELRAQGVTHVIVSESDYGKFFLESLKPKADEQESFLRRKAFYEQLSREEELLREWERGTVIYLHPGLRVYRLRTPVAPLPAR